MMKRAGGIVLLLLTSFLVAPPRAEAQCTKRILIYLDISGSMDPRGKTPDSPFRQSISAFQMLLQQEGFLDAGDVVEIALFGDRIEERYTARGPAEVAQRLDELSRFAGLESWTDFERVFADLDRSLQAETPFGRQVVILASDFFHEPEAASRTGEFLRSWQAVFSKWQPVLEERLVDRGKLPVLLFKAPVAFASRRGDSGLTVQAEVIADLTRSLVPAGQVFDLGRGGMAAADLAAGIRKELLFPPVVKAGLDKVSRRDIEVQIQNQNCYPLTLERIDLVCKGSDGTAVGDPAQLAFGLGDADIQPSGSQQIVGAPPSGPCWQQAADFEAVVYTREGVVGRSQGTAGTWLEASPTAVYLEHNLIGSNVLRLELELTGLRLAEKEFEITVLEGAGQESREVAKGRFSAPHDVDPDQKKPYRIVFPVKDSVKEGLEDGDALTVRLDGGRPQEEKSVKLRKDDPRSFTNALSIAVTLISCALVLGSLVYRRRADKRPIGRALDMVSLVSWAGQTIITLTPLFLVLARSFLLQRIPFSWIDFLKTTSMVLAISWAIFLFIRNIQKAQLIRGVYGGERLTIDMFEHKARSGWIAWTAALATVVLLCGGFMLFDVGAAEAGSRAQRIALIRD